MFTLILATLSTLLTSFYSFRLLKLVFWGSSNFSKNRLYEIQESSKYILIPIFLLSAFSIFSGYMFKDLFVGLGTTFWNNSLYVSTKSKFAPEVEFLPFIIKSTPIVFSFFGTFLVFYLHQFPPLNFFKSKIYYDLYLFLNSRWYIDSVVNVYINQFILSKSDLFFIKELDKGILEFIGPKGFVLVFSTIVRSIKQKYIGRLQVYLVMLLFNIFVLLGLLCIYVIFL
jgi:NADH-ubiquinone oxidoreductase chain 5